VKMRNAVRGHDPAPCQRNRGQHKRMARAWIVLRNQVQWPFRLAVKIEPRCRTPRQFEPDQILTRSTAHYASRSVGRVAGRHPLVGKGLLAPPNGSYRADINTIKT
jgi:hypothetical protein